jgi:tetratricopeptide (TPR) repeat protein
MIKYLFFYIFTFLFFLTGTAQEKKPFNLELYFNRSINETERVQIKENIYQYSQQIKNNPIDPSLYVNRGVQYAFLGLYPDAISDYNKALKIDSTLAEAYYNRGIAKSRFAYTKNACLDVKKSALFGLPQGKSLYDKKCGLYMKELGELP